MANHKKKKQNAALSWQHATGKMPYKLTNDYLFRATLQRSNRALKGLICALLGLQPEEIQSVVIMNPIELGKHIDAKDFILDIRVILNNNTMINIEMQVMNLGNWPERSLGYLCRSFDTLNKGEDYRDTKPVIQVCFLDFTLFEEVPEFYANYMFINVKNHYIYSDKLKLSVVDLTQIDIATEEDKQKGLDQWARLFKATTWEEIKMLASKNEYLTDAAETAYQLVTEETIRMQCEAREDYYNHQRYIKKKMAELEQMLANDAEALAAKDNELAAKDNELAAKDKELADKDALIARLQEELATKR